MGRHPALAFLQSGASLENSGEAKEGSRQMAELKPAEIHFLKMLGLILLAAVLMAGAAILYLGATGELQFHLVVATLVGVFVSVVLGCGLFALSFFSDRSGHDALASEASCGEGVDTVPEVWPAAGEGISADPPASHEP